MMNSRRGMPPRLNRALKITRMKGTNHRGTRAVRAVPIRAAKPVALYSSPRMDDSRNRKKMDGMEEPMLSGRTVKKLSRNPSSVTKDTTSVQHSPTMSGGTPLRQKNTNAATQRMTTAAENAVCMDITPPVTRRGMPRAQELFICYQYGARRGRMPLLVLSVFRLDAVPAGGMAWPLRGK